MPTVAIVDGVQIRFYPREHPPPHFHAILAEYRARIEIQPLRVLTSNFPPAKLAAVLSSAQPRTQALLDTWQVVVSKKKPEKIR